MLLHPVALLEGLFSFQSRAGLYLSSLQHSQATRHLSIHCGYTSTENQHTCISLGKEIVLGWGRSALLRSVLLPQSQRVHFLSIMTGRTDWLKAISEAALITMLSWIVIVVCRYWGGVPPININGLVLWGNAQGPHRRLTYLGINTAVARLVPEFKCSKAFSYSNTTIYFFFL